MEVLFFSIDNDNKKSWRCIKKTLPVFKKNIANVLKKS